MARPLFKKMTFRKTGMNLAVWCVLILAAGHCARSIYVSSISFVNWDDYVAGKLAMPFQGRIGMMPILRAANGSRLIQELAVKLQLSSRSTKLQEPFTAIKAASFLVSLMALLVMVVSAAWYATRHWLRPWWLASAIVLNIVMVTLAVRSEMNYWYPYDLPHAALFGLACICILEDMWIPFVILFIIDIPMRETGVFLIVLAVATLGYKASDRRRISAGLFGLGLLIYALVVRILIQHRFRSNPSAVGSYLTTNMHMLSPFHWPQLLSAGGYLALFVWLQRWRLRSRERIFLWACLACVPVTLYFGIWMETRIWLEWTIPLAILGASEWSHYVVNDVSFQDSVPE